MFEITLQVLASVMKPPAGSYGSYWPNDRGKKLGGVEERGGEGGLWEAFSNYSNDRTQMPEICKKRKGSPWKGQKE